MYYLFSSELSASNVAFTLKEDYAQVGRLFVIVTEETRLTVETVVDLLGERENYISRPRKSQFSTKEEYFEAQADWKEMEDELGLMN